MNLNFLLSSNGYHPYVFHLPLLFAVSWATWDTVKKFCFKDEIEIVFVSMSASHSFFSKNDSVEHSHIVLG